MVQRLLLLHRGCYALRQSLIKICISLVDKKVDAAAMLAAAIIARGAWQTSV
jgi:hypothetical protein